MLDMYLELVKGYLYDSKEEVKISILRQRIIESFVFIMII